jgi:hypothetical protein
MPGEQFVDVVKADPRSLVVLATLFSGNALD